MTPERGKEALEVRMGTVMRALAGADDLTTALLWDVERQPGQPDAPAWFSPATRTVSINAVFALQGDDPGTVNPLTPEGRRKHPHIIGLGCHEASHVRFTQWGEEWQEVLAKESPSVREVATVLEEPRIEKRYLSVRPQDRGYLRAQSILIDTSQFSPPTEEEREAMEEEGWVDGWRAGILCLLTLARGDAGVLEPEDLINPRRVLSLVLGDTLDRLEPLWREALELEDGDVEGLISVARRWVEEVGEKPRCLTTIIVCPGDPPEAPEFADDLLGDRPDDGDTVAFAGGGDLLSDLMDSLTEEIEHEIEVEAGAQEQAEAKEQEERSAREQEARDAKDQAKAQKKAQDFFNDPNGGSKKLNMAKESERREATDVERQLAVRLAREIKRARFRERDKITTLSERPPGRLQGREAMLYSAQRSMRMQTTARPFRDRMSRYTEEPPLSLGVMTDISGSMTAFAPFATAFSWASAQAVKGVGRAVSVAYDTRVTVLNAPGEHPQKPYPLTANGAGEDWKTAFAIVDGALNLSTGRGARLLFVLSDGEYAPMQAKAAQADIQRLERGGAKVIWFGPARASNQGLMSILGRRGESRFIPVNESFTQAMGQRMRPRVDQADLVETVIAEITASLRQSLRK